MREGFQSDTTDTTDIPQSYIPIQRPAGASYAAQLVIDMKNAVGEKINTYIANYAFQKVRNASGVETSIPITYRAFYKAELQDVYRNIPTVIDEVIGITSTEPVDSTGASTEGMRRLKALYATYVGYLDDLEKDRPLAQLKKVADDTMKRFNKYYAYVTDISGNNSTGISSEDLGMYVPSDEEKNSDRTILLNATSTSPVEEVKTKYERLLYNDVVSVAGRGVPNDILARLKFQVDSAMKDFEEQYGTLYGGVPLNTYFSDISGGKEVNDIAGNLRRDRTRMEGYAALAIIRTPYSSSEPGGNNRVMLYALIGLYSRYKGGVGKLKGENGLVASARAMADLNIVREKCKSIIKMYGDIYNSVIDIITLSTSEATGVPTEVSLTVFDPTTIITEQTDQIPVGGTNLQRIDLISKMVDLSSSEKQDMIIRIQTNYTRDVTGHFYILLTFVKDRTYELMSFVKQLCKSNPPQKIFEYTPIMTNACSSLPEDRLPKDTVDGRIIGLTNASNYLSFSNDTPSIIKKYIQAREAFLDEIQKYRIFVGSSSSLLDDIQTRYFDVVYSQLVTISKIIDESSLLTTYPSIKKLSDRNSDKQRMSSDPSLYDVIFKQYVDSIKFIFIEARKSINRLFTEYKNIYDDNIDLIGTEFLPDVTVIKPMYDSIQTTSAEVQQKVDLFVKLVWSDIKSFDPYPLNSPIEILSLYIINIYRDYIYNKTAIELGIGLIPEERVYVLNSKNRDYTGTNNNEFEIPNTYTSYFDTLDYILVGGGGSGSAASQYGGGGTGGGSGFLVSSIPGNFLSKYPLVILNSDYTDITENRYQNVPLWPKPNGSVSLKLSKQTNIKIRIGRGGKYSGGNEKGGGLDLTGAGEPGESTVIFLNDTSAVEAFGANQSVNSYTVPYSVNTYYYNYKLSGLKIGGRGSREQTSTRDCGENTFILKYLVCGSESGTSDAYYSQSGPTALAFSTSGPLSTVTSESTADGGKGGGGGNDGSAPNIDSSSSSNGQSGGGGAGGIGKGYSEVSKISGRTTSGGTGASAGGPNTNAQAGEDYTGAGGGGAAFFDSSNFGNTGNGGCGYAILVFKRTPKTPLSLLQNFIHNYDINYDYPQINFSLSVPQNASSFDTFSDAVLSCKSDINCSYILFSPRSMKYFTFFSSASPTKITNIADMGTTVWRKLTSTSTTYWRYGYVPKLLGGNTDNMRTVLQQQQLSVPAPPPEQALTYSADATESSTYAVPNDGITTVVSGKLTVKKPDMFGLISENSLGIKKDANQIINKSCLFILCQVSLISGNSQWVRIIDFGDSKLSNNIIIARSGSAPYLTTVNIINKDKDFYIENDFTNIPFVEGKSFIVAARFSTNKTSLWFKDFDTVHTDILTQSIQTPSNTIARTFKDMAFGNQLMGSPTPLKVGSTPAYKCYIFAGDDERFPDSKVRHYINWLYAIRNGGTITESFVNPPRELQQSSNAVSSDHTPIFRSGATLDAAFTGSLLR